MQSVTFIQTIKKILRGAWLHAWIEYTCVMFEDCLSKAERFRWCFVLCRVESHCSEVIAESSYSDEQRATEKVIIVAGDVSDDVGIFRKTFELLTSAYEHVFFVSGNHELWVRKKDREKYDSLGKLRELMRICEELGVKTYPAKIGSKLWVVPLWSWYHASWDREPDIPGAYPIEKVMMDFHACDWSSVPHLNAAGDDSLAIHFDEMNADEYIKALDSIRMDRLSMEAEEKGDVFVVSFSHFLPYQTLLPEKRWLFYPNLAKASGSDHLARRIEELKPDCHVYGHTHFTQDHTMEGTRFVQWPLGYPKEMQRRRNGGQGWKPCLLWDVHEGESTRRSSYWSDFYRNNERKAHITTPAPYVSVRSTEKKGSPTSPSRGVTQLSARIT